MPDDEAQANARAPKRQHVAEGGYDNLKESLQCQVCYRSYERADHLNRHLDSRKHVIGQILRLEVDEV